MKKTVSICLLFMIFIVIVFIFYKSNNKEETVVFQEKTFNIEKISIYSGVSGENVSENYQNPEWNLDIYQYSDIAIYLNRIEDFKDNNNIKRMYIDNINLGMPKSGVPKLYYLNPLNYGTSDINVNNEIVNDLEFNILNSENLENDISYSIPILFQDLSNPITLKYVNTNIIKSYKISNESKITFDGTLLKLIRVNPKNIENTISFNINIETYNDKLIYTRLDIEIPLKDNEGNSLYDGNINYEKVYEQAF